MDFFWLHSFWHTDRQSELQFVYLVALRISTQSRANIPPVFSPQENIKKEVEVVQPYESVISDAFKINNLPEIEGVQRIDPNFEYSITPKLIVSDFEVRPISPAKMVPTKLSQYG